MSLIYLSFVTVLPLLYTVITEQTAIYSREFAQAAFGCCPLGRREHKDRIIQDIHTLKKLEKEALHQLMDAHHNLLHARKRATANALPGTNTKFASEEERHTFEEPQTIEEGQSSTLTHRTITGRFTGKLYHRKHLISTNTTFESSLESILLDNE